MRIFISLLIAIACYYAFFFMSHLVHIMPINQPWWVAPTIFLLMAFQATTGIAFFLYAWQLFWDDDQTKDDVTSTKNDLNSPSVLTDTASSYNKDTILKAHDNKE